MRSAKKYSLRAYTELPKVGSYRRDGLPLPGARTERFAGVRIQTKQTPREDLGATQRLARSNEE